VEHHSYRIPDAELEPQDVEDSAGSRTSWPPGSTRARGAGALPGGLNRSSLVAALALVRRGYAPQEAIDAIRNGRNQNCLFNRSFVRHIPESAAAPGLTRPRLQPDHVGQPAVGPSARAPGPELLRLPGAGEREGVGDVPGRRRLCGARGPRQNARRRATVGRSSGSRTRSTAATVSPHALVRHADDGDLAPADG
jgi:hypothetical protein